MSSSDPQTLLGIQGDTANPRREPPQLIPVDEDRGSPPSMAVATALSPLTPSSERPPNDDVSNRGGRFHDKSFSNQSMTVMDDPRVSRLAAVEYTNWGTTECAPMPQNLGAGFFRDARARPSDPLCNKIAQRAPHGGPNLHSLHER